jgi:hypothetical protein
MINQTERKENLLHLNNGLPCLVYWDLENDGWRMATGEAKVRT